MAALLSQAIVQMQKSVILISTKGEPTYNAHKQEDIRKDVKMPHTVQMRRSAMHVLGEDLSAAIYTAMRRVADYRTYRRSVSELSDLSARELADLGMHRSEIRRVAYETVYGQQP
ncbi:DUF1127 domain-containing protein [Roseovarius tibetensis]|uniref:DUF1127 domain-containing protein n=1 Tax=Roseovarius tibetensis TaxID=2685897 RepID=UPI003D7F4EEB